MIFSYSTNLKKILFALFTLFALTNISIGQSKFDKIDELMTTYTDYGQFNGSILVAQNGKVVYKKGFGYANMEWNIPNQSDTKHRLASVTKQFTAMLIMQLVADGKLDLEAPITTYLPDYPSKNGNRINTHHLLTHTSGTPNFTSFPGYRKEMRKSHKPNDLVQLFADSTLEFTPGEKFQYSNSGYILLGVIIENITGKTFERALEDQIFKPLKMTNSGYDHNNQIIKNRATGYQSLGRQYRISDFIDMSTPYAAGSIYSTAEDLYLWDRALYTELLLPKKYLDLIFQSHIPTRSSHYGYGWGIGEMNVGNTKEKKTYIGHGGGINGFNTQISRYPDDQSLVILLNNTGGAPLYKIDRAILGILQDKSYDFPKKSLAHTLIKTIENDGLVSALEEYKNLKDSSTFQLNEHEMNMVGYELLKSGQLKEAAAVFKLNIDAYPNSFNVYDSYGEVLLKLGQKEKAIENYKISIKKNPKNQHGLDVLHGLGVNTEGLVNKIPTEQLNMLVGEYLITNPPNEGNEDWKIVFESKNGQLFGNDRGYRYSVILVEGNEFVNPDDGASISFDTKNKNAITMKLFKKYIFKKIK